jgi:hypothetical protein
LFERHSWNLCTDVWERCLLLKKSLKFGILFGQAMRPLVQFFRMVGKLKFLPLLLMEANLVDSFDHVELRGWHLQTGCPVETYVKLWYQKLKLKLLHLKS